MKKEGKGTHTARYFLMITPDSSKTIETERPESKLFIRAGCRIIFVRLLPNLQQVLEARVPKGPMQKHQRTRLRKEVEGKQLEGKQLEGNKLESKTKAPDVHSPFLARGI